MARPRRWLAALALAVVGTASPGLARAWAPAQPSSAADVDDAVADPPTALGPRIVAPRLAPDLGGARSPASASGLGLSRLVDGRYAYTDPGHRFVARIEPDGSVRFADRWRRVDDRTAGKRKPERGRAGGVPSEGLLRATDPFGGAQVPGPAEWALRARGHDPTASAKAAWLDRTAEFRARLAVAWQRDLLRTQLSALPERLDALWADDARTVAQRRARLFAQWDECLEPVKVTVKTKASTPILLRDRTRAAAEARDIIERFVRDKLPAGSPDAYTDAELSALNAGRDSRERFEPYRDASPETSESPT